MWPASLQHLTFGDRFHQAIDQVVWPASLQQLTFGNHINQAIDIVVWPASLQQLTLEYILIRPLTESTSQRHSSSSISDMVSSTDRRPHGHVDRLVEAISEGELLKRGWHHDLNDRPIKMIPEREMLERRRPHLPVDRPV